jgi:uncharacterized Zn-binding protein involved in type VI secretion
LGIIKYGTGKIEGVGWRYGQLEDGPTPPEPPPPPPPFITGGVAISRISDETFGEGSHGRKCCPHSFTGFIVQGSDDVFADDLGIARIGDIGIHMCPHCQTNTLVMGSTVTFANEIAVVRVGDTVNEVCGTGIVTSGSNTTFD